MNKIRWKWRILDGFLLGGVLLLVVCLCVEPFRKEEGWGFFERMLFKSKSPRENIDINSYILEQNQISSFLRSYPQIGNLTFNHTTFPKEPTYLVLCSINHYKFPKSIWGTYLYTLQDERPFGEISFLSMRYDDNTIQLIRPVYGVQNPKISSKDKNCWIYSFINRK